MAVLVKGNDKRTGRTVEVEHGLVQEYTFTAEEIAARWDTENHEAFVEIEDADNKDIFAFGWSHQNTLDSDVSLDSVYAYLPGKSTDEVYDNGESAFLVQELAAGTYVRKAQFPNIYVSEFRPGSALYVGFSANDPPTVGKITVRLLILK